MNKRDIISAIIGNRKTPVTIQGKGSAPSNIALCKYWGKRDIELNLPVTSSLSISLGHLGTATEIEPVSGKDIFILNGRPVPDDTAFAKRLTAYLDLYRPEMGAGYKVVTVNSIPTAAGLASSASGYAALVKALDVLHGWNLAPRELSILARIGSGSASRSIFHGFVEWHAGKNDDGSDSYAEPLPVMWPELRVGLVKISVEEKSISSRDAMKRTVETSVLYRSWPEQVERDLASVHSAIRAKDFVSLGRAAENNALSMHATAIAAWPPALFWLPESIKAMYTVWKLREDDVPVYFTMDAGPNLKLLVEKQNVREIQEEFPDVEWVVPFDETAQPHTTSSSQ